MEIISIIIALILAIMFNKIKRIIIALITLSGVYVVLKTFHSELQILPLKEWTLNNLFNGYNFWYEGFFWFFTILLIFNWFVPKLLSHFLVLLKERTSKRHNAKIVFQEMKPFIKFLFNVIFFLASITEYKTSKQKNKVFDFDVFIDNFILFFSILLQIIFTIPFFIENTFMISLIIILGFTFYYFGLPFSYLLINEIRLFIEQEIELKKYQTKSNYEHNTNS